MSKQLMLFMMTTFLAMTIWSCENTSDDDMSGNDISVIVTEATEWRVTYYWDKDKDETSDFQGYSFQFEDDGSLLAFQGGNLTFTGSWSVNSSSNKLVLNLGQLEPLDELTDDWLIINKSNVRIELKDDNDEHLEELHLEKVN